MTEADLRGAVEGALTVVPFTPPLSLAYCVAVRDELRARLPGAQIVEAYHRIRELVVEVRQDGAQYKLNVPLGQFS